MNNQGSSIATLSDAVFPQSLCREQKFSARINTAGTFSQMCVNVILIYSFSLSDWIVSLMYFITMTIEKFATDRAMASDQS